MEIINEGYKINWDSDWTNCQQIFPKSSRYRWCNKCFSYHDVDAFNHYHGKAGSCVVTLDGQRRVMAKVKGGPTAKK